MKYAVRAATAAVTTAALLFMPPLVSADSHALLKDAGFEQGLGADKGGWTLFGGSKIASDHARKGGQSMLNGAISKAVAYPPYFVGMISGSFQELEAEPGSSWRLTGYGMTPAALKGAPAFGIVQISFFDADGNDLGTVETAGKDAAKAKLSNEVNNRTPAGEWVFLDTGIATAPAGTTAVQAFTLYVDYSGASVFQGVYFDDLSLCKVDGSDASTGSRCDE